MLLIYGNEATWDTVYGERRDQVMRGHDALIKELTESGELVGFAGLTTANARTVRVSDGVAAVTDGPFAEAKEILAGYYLIDCDSAERATELAARIPEAELSPVEVRQLMDVDRST